MSFLSRLFGGGDRLRGTPVADWPPASGQSPQISLERKALEAFSRVPFGAPFDRLRVIGRPDAYRSSREGFATLTLGSSGAGTFPSAGFRQLDVLPLGRS